MKKTLLIAVTSCIVSTQAFALDGASAERGKNLFESVGLGKSGKSCASCHQGGKKLEWAATYDDDKLAEIINRCIRGPLQGTPLDEKSDDMKSLITYIKTFAGPGR